MKNVVIKNLFIPKDTTIMLQNKVAQTQEAYFSKPNDFIPERWIKNGCPMHENHSPEMMRAFGAGARFCPGKNLAMHEMIICISSICKKYNLDLAVKANQVKEMFFFTMYPENLLIKLHNPN